MGEEGIRGKDHFEEKLTGLMVLDEDKRRYEAEGILADALSAMDGPVLETSIEIAEEFMGFFRMNHSLLEKVFSPIYEKMAELLASIDAERAFSYEMHDIRSVYIDDLPLMLKTLDEIGERHLNDDDVYFSEYALLTGIRESEWRELEDSEKILFIPLHHHLLRLYEKAGFSEGVIRESREMEELCRLALQLMPDNVEYEKKLLSGMSSGLSCALSELDSESVRTFVSDSIEVFSSVSDDAIEQEPHSIGAFLSSYAVFMSREGFIDLDTDEVRNIARVIDRCSLFENGKSLVRLYDVYSSYLLIVESDYDQASTYAVKGLSLVDEGPSVLRSALEFTLDAVSAFRNIDGVDVDSFRERISSVEALACDDDGLFRKNILLADISLFIMYLMLEKNGKDKALELLDSNFRTGADGDVLAHSYRLCMLYEERIKDEYEPEKVGFWNDVVIHLLKYMDNGPTMYWNLGKDAFKLLEYPKYASRCRYWNFFAESIDDIFDLIHESGYDSSIHMMVEAVTYSLQGVYDGMCNNQSAIENLEKADVIYEELWNGSGFAGFNLYAYYLVCGWLVEAGIIRKKSPENALATLERHYGKISSIEGFGSDISPYIVALYLKHAEIKSACSSYDDANSEWKRIYEYLKGLFIDCKGGLVGFIRAYRIFAIDNERKAKSERLEKDLYEAVDGIDGYFNETDRDVLIDGLYEKGEAKRRSGAKDEAVRCLEKADRLWNGKYRGVVHFNAVDREISILESLSRAENDSCHAERALFLLSHVDPDDRIEGRKAELEKLLLELDEPTEPDVPLPQNISELIDAIKSESDASKAISIYEHCSIGKDEISEEKDNASILYEILSGKYAGSGNLEKAETYLDDAISVIAETGDDRRLAGLYGRLAELLKDSNPDKAISAHETRISLSGTVDDRTVARIELVSFLKSRNEVDKVRKTYADMRKDIQTSGLSSLYLAECLHGYGYFEYGKDNYDLAIELFDESLAMYKSLNLKTSRSSRLYSYGDDYFCKARIYRSRNDVDDSRDNYVLCLGIWKDIAEDLDELWALKNVKLAYSEFYALIRKSGDIDYNVGILLDYEKVILRLLDCGYDTVNKYDDLRYIYGEIAWQYRQEKRNEEAIPYLEKVFELLKTGKSLIPDDRKEKYVWVYLDYGRCLLELGRRDEAKSVWENGIDFISGIELTRVNDKDIHTWIYADLGRLAISDGEMEEAEKHLIEALVLAEAYYDEEKRSEYLDSILYFHIYLDDVYESSDEKGMRNLDALEDASRLVWNDLHKRDKYLDFLRRSYELRADRFQAMGDKEKALQYYRKITDMTDEALSACSSIDSSYFIYSHYKAGKMLFELERYDEACSILEKGMLLYERLDDRSVDSSKFAFYGLDIMANIAHIDNDTQLECSRRRKAWSVSMEYVKRKGQLPYFESWLLNVMRLVLLIPEDDITSTYPELWNEYVESTSYMVGHDDYSGYDEVSAFIGGMVARLIKMDDREACGACLDEILSIGLSSTLRNSAIIMNNAFKALIVIALNNDDFKDELLHHLSGSLQTRMAIVEDSGDLVVQNDFLAVCYSVFSELVSNCEEYGTLAPIGNILDGVLGLLERSSNKEAVGRLLDGYLEEVEERICIYALDGKTNRINALVELLRILTGEKAYMLTDTESCEINHLYILLQAYSNEEEDLFSEFLDSGEPFNHLSPDTIEHVASCVNTFVSLAYACGFHEVAYQCLVKAMRIFGGIEWVDLHIPEVKRLLSVCLFPALTLRDDMGADFIEEKFHSDPYRVLMICLFAADLENSNAYRSLFYKDHSKESNVFVDIFMKKLSELEDSLSTEELALLRFLSIVRQYCSCTWAEYLSFYNDIPDKSDEIRHEFIEFTASHGKQVPNIVNMQGLKEAQSIFLNGRLEDRDELVSNALQECAAKARFHLPYDVIVDIWDLIRNRGLKIPTVFIMTFNISVKNDECDIEFAYDVLLHLADGMLQEVEDSENMVFPLLEEICLKYVNDRNLIGAEDFFRFLDVYIRLYEENGKSGSMSETSAHSLLSALMLSITANDAIALQKRDEHIALCERILDGLDHVDDPSLTGMRLEVMASRVCTSACRKEIGKAEEEFRSYLAELERNWSSLRSMSYADTLIDRILIIMMMLPDEERSLRIHSALFDECLEIRNRYPNNGLRNVFSRIAYELCIYYEDTGDRTNMEAVLNNYTSNRFADDESDYDRYLMDKHYSLKSSAKDDMERSFDYRTRNGESPGDKSNVYLTGNMTDLEKFGEAIEGLILQSIDTSVWFPNGELEFDENLKASLAAMNLLVLLVSSDTIGKDSGKWKDLTGYMQELDIPVLPVLLEPGLEARFNGIFGNLHSLRFHRGYEFAVKLDSYLKSHMIRNDIAKEIRSEFPATIFVSYRRQDKSDVLKLVKTIHAMDFAREVRVWFDDFLTPGENFTHEIRSALLESDLFLLAITPRILEENNYVLTDEYPLALQHKKMLKVEVRTTSRLRLDQVMKDEHGLVSLENLEDALKDALSDVDFSRNTGARHDYLMGLAYLRGIDVEINRKYAFDFLSRAVEAGSNEAVLLVLELLDSDGKAFDPEERCRYLKRLELRNLNDVDSLNYIAAQMEYIAFETSLDGDESKMPFELHSLCVLDSISAICRWISLGNSGQATDSERESLLRKVEYPLMKKGESMTYWALTSDSMTSFYAYAFIKGYSSLDASSPEEMRFLALTFAFSLFHAFGHALRAEYYLDTLEHLMADYELDEALRRKLELFMLYGRACVEGESSEKIDLLEEARDKLASSSDFLPFEKSLIGYDIDRTLACLYSSEPGHDARSLELNENCLRYAKEMKPIIGVEYYYLLKGTILNSVSYHSNGLVDPKAAEGRISDLIGKMVATGNRSATFCKLLSNLHLCLFELFSYYKDSEEAMLNAIGYNDAIEAAGPLARINNVKYYIMLGIVMYEHEHDAAVAYFEKGYRTHLEIVNVPTDRFTGLSELDILKNYSNYTRESALASAVVQAIRADVLFFHRFSVSSIEETISIMRACYKAAVEVDALDPEKSESYYRNTMTILYPILSSLQDKEFEDILEACIRRILMLARSRKDFKGQKEILDEYIDFQRRVLGVEPDMKWMDQLIILALNQAETFKAENEWDKVVGLLQTAMSEDEMIHGFVVDEQRYLRSAKAYETIIGASEHNGNDFIVWHWASRYAFFLDRYISQNELELDMELKDQLSSKIVHNLEKAKHLMDKASISDEKELQDYDRVLRMLYERTGKKSYIRESEAVLEKLCDSYPDIGNRVMLANHLYRYGNDRGLLKADRTSDGLKMLEEIYSEDPDMLTDELLAAIGKKA